MQIRITSPSFQTDLVPCQGGFLPPPVSLAQVPLGADSETGHVLAGVSRMSAPRNNPCQGVKGAGLSRGRRRTTTPQEALKLE